MRLRDANTPSLAAELRKLRQQFRDRPVCLGEVMHALQHRGYELMLLVLTLPFLTPVPLPFLSTPFGLMIALIGFRLARGRRPRLPQRLMQRRLPPRFFPRLLRAASGLVGALEWLTRPRLQFFHEGIVFKRTAGVMIGLSGLLLLLPLPVPFSNFFPAATVMLLAAGALDRDGLFFLGGSLMFCVQLGFFVLIPLGGIELVNRVWAGT